MIDKLQGFIIYMWFYLDLQIRQIGLYWIAGIVIGSCISVFLKNRLHAAAAWLGHHVPGMLGLAAASALGILSPLCMYGTIPLAAAFSKSGVEDDYLAAFMMSSVLLNPQLIIYSVALGRTALVLRIVCCFLCGLLAGVLVRLYLQHIKSDASDPAWHTAENADGRNASPALFFNFTGFEEDESRDTDPNPLKRLVFNIGRNIRATGPWFFFGLLLSAIFTAYVPEDVVVSLFGKSNKGFGLLMAATIGVPLYACGGGTIPLLRQWLATGMSMGAAVSFMITGPSTAIRNMGALKIVLGAKHFLLYLAFASLSALAMGFAVNLFL
ncbi:MAG: permease [Eubacteriales bacterium]|nr:permease [Eubacteriales bacterium]